MHKPEFECKRCGHQWNRRRNTYTQDGSPKLCPKCKSPYWQTVRTRATGAKRTKHLPPQPVTFDYEDITNAGGEEHSLCMYFDDESDVPQSCMEPGHNVATIEVPLYVVDVTWRNLNVQQTRPAAHPSERGCYVTMPLVLCLTHLKLMRARWHGEDMIAPCKYVPKSQRAQ